MDVHLTEFDSHEDDRGRLVVFLLRSELAEQTREFGQIYFVTFDGIGTVRGNHYHERWREWFGIITGQLKVSLKDVETGERRELVLDASRDRYTRLEVGPGIVHAFESLTEHASMLNYADAEWEESDCHPHSLI